MHAFLALVIALAAPALAGRVPARVGYEREIDSTKYNLVPEQLNPYILNQGSLGALKNRAKLITRPIPEDNSANESLLVESNSINIVTPIAKRNVDRPASDALVRNRRGYNLENVRVPARYPYLPVPNYNRFRRWG